MSDMAERQKTPAIVSLQNLEIQLNDEIRNHLSAQYDDDHDRNRNRNDNDNDNERGDGSQHKKGDDRFTEDGRRLELILEAMKRPPAFTTCRVNLIKATRKEVLDELHSLLSTTPQLEVLEDTGFPDVINIVPTESDGTSGGEKIKDGAFDKPFLLSSLTGPDGNYSEGDEENATVKNTDVPTNDPLFSNWPSRREQGWSMTHRSIICDRFCGEAVLRGSDIFVMGVMAADTNIRAGENVAIYADIPWKTNESNGKGPKNGCVSDGKLIRGLKLEQYRGRCVYLGLGRAECSRSEIFKKTKGVAITMSLDAKDRVGPPLPPLYGVLPDKMMLQNLPSVLVGHALNPQQDDVILDMCSAPGGKTSHLASLVRNEAVIVACDKSKKKVAAAKELFVRMGASCITPLALDATNCCAEKESKKDGDKKDSPDQEVKDVRQILRDAPVDKGGLKQIKKFYEESFDKILLDPPCSALGLRPKLFVAQNSLRELEKHAEYQRKFVEQAVKLLKVGGHMTYSTCTINGSENEGMVSHILKEYPCMELLPIDLPFAWRQKHLGLPGLDGLGLSSEERNCVCRFDPSSMGDTMGFFVALFRKHS